VPSISDDIAAVVGPLLARYLVEAPVEAKGILSRIETHIAGLRDYLHGATASMQPPDALSWQILLREIRSIADHDAQIGAARHEFLRAFLVQLDERMQRIETFAYGLDSKEKAMTRLVQLERRIKKLEEMHQGQGSEVEPEEGGKANETV